MARLALIRMNSTSRPGQNSSMILRHDVGSMPCFSMPRYRLSQSWSFHLAFSVAYTTFLGLKNRWFSEPSALSASARVTASLVAFAHATRGSSVPGPGVPGGVAIIVSAMISRGCASGAGGSEEFKQHA